jgi:hypothetical protein
MRLDQKLRCSILDLHDAWMVVVYERFWSRLSLLLAFETSTLSMVAAMEFMALVY